MNKPKKPRSNSADNTQKLTIAAYNMGPSALKKLMREHRTSSYDRLRKHLPKETRDLVDFSIENRIGEGNVEGYEPLIQAAFKLSNAGEIDMSNLNLGLIQPHIYKESYTAKDDKKYDPNARSHVGAKGLGQFTPITLNEFQRLGWLRPGENPYDVNKSSELILRYQDHIAKSLLKESGKFNMGGYIPKAQGGLNVTNNWLQGLQKLFNQDIIGQLPILSGDKPGVDHTQLPITDVSNSVTSEINQPLEPIQTLAPQAVTSDSISNETLDFNFPEQENKPNKFKETLKGVGKGIATAVPLLGNVAMTGASMWLGHKQQQEQEQQSMFSELARYMGSAEIPINKGMNATSLPIAQKGMAVPKNPYGEGTELGNIWQLRRQGYNPIAGTLLQHPTDFDQDRLLYKGDSLSNLSSELSKNISDLSPEGLGSIFYPTENIIDPGKTKYSGAMKMFPVVDSNKRFKTKQEASDYLIKTLRKIPGNTNAQARNFDTEKDDKGYFVYESAAMHDVLPTRYNQPRTQEELELAKSMGYDPATELITYGIGKVSDEKLTALSPKVAEHFVNGPRVARLVNGKIQHITNPEEIERIKKLPTTRTVDLRSGEKSLYLDRVFKSGGLIPTSNLGQWKYPGQVVNVPSNNITMRGINHPNLGISDNGMVQMMLPGMNYNFPGAKNVLEIPMLRYGGSVVKKYQKGRKVPKETASESTSINRVLPVIGDLPTDLIPSGTGGFWSPSESGKYDANGNLRLAPGTVIPVDDPLTGTGRSLVTGAIKKGPAKAIEKVIVNKVRGKAKDAVVGAVLDELDKQYQSTGIDNTRVNTINPILNGLPTDLVPVGRGYLSPSQNNQEVLQRGFGLLMNPDGTPGQLVMASGQINPVDDPFTMALVDGTLGGIAKGVYKTVTKNAVKGRTAPAARNIINQDMPFNPNPQEATVPLYRIQAKDFEELTPEEAMYSNISKNVHRRRQHNLNILKLYGEEVLDAMGLMPPSYRTVTRTVPVSEGSNVMQLESFDIPDKKNYKLLRNIERLSRNNINNNGVASNFAKYYGNWWGHDPKYLIENYIDKINRFPKGNTEMFKLDVPRSFFERRRVNVLTSVDPNLKWMSGDHSNEFILPPNWKQYATKIGDFQSGGHVIDPSLASLSQILTLRNQNLPWVNRAVSGNTQAIYNNAGQAQTHLMGYDGPDRNGNAYVSPTLDMTQSLMGPNMLIPTMSAPAMRIPNMRLADFYTRQGLIRH